MELSMWSSLKLGAVGLTCLVWQPGAIAKPQPAPLPAVDSAETVPVTTPANAADRPADAGGEVVWVGDAEAAPALTPLTADRVADATLPLTLAQTTQPRITGIQILGATPELQPVVEELIESEVGDPLNLAQLQADTAAIRATGLFQTVSATQIAVPGGVNVVFQVYPIIVEGVVVEGNEAMPEAVAEQIFAPQFNQPISPIDLDVAIAAMNQWYIDNGYLLARAIALSPAPDGTITVTVAEGVVNSLTFQFVDDDGNTVDENGEPIEGRTRQSFLEQETNLTVGDPFREDVVRRDLQNLARLNLFDSVDVVLEGDSSQVDVIYSINESPPRSFNLGGGIDGDGIFGSVSYTDRNVGGIGQRLEADVAVSDEIDVQFNAAFVSPYRSGVPDRLGYSVRGSRRRFLSPTFTDELEFANGDRIREGRFGGGFTLSRGFDDWLGTASFSYTRVSLRDADGDIRARDEAGNPLSVSGTGEDDLFTVGVRFVQDLRDDTAVPRSGSLLSLSTTQSLPIGLGSIAYNQLQANYVYYIPMTLLGGGDLERNPEVMVLNLQGGTAIGELPPYEAFNLGGGNSVRGYGESDVGTGRSYILASAEYRFPIVQPVGGAVFLDFASDLGSGDTVLGDPGPERDKPGTGFGVGVGVRVPSFLGLLRADFGINDDGGNEFFFGIGQRY